MTRTAALLLMLALPALAHAETVSGTVRVSGRKVQVVDGARAVRLAGDLANTIMAFAGRRVELVGSGSDRAFQVARIASPVREEKTLTAHQQGESWGLRGDDEVYTAFGRVDLLTVGRELTLDLWVFPAKPGAKPAACVVAVEGLTVGDWTFLRRTYYGYTILSGFVRGQGRSVWVTDRKDGQLYVRRGEDAGWVPEDDLRVGEETRAGMSERLGGS